MHARATLGREGEALACDLLRAKGFRIVERNFRNGREGEVDVIAADRATLVFCEVKTRRSTRWGDPSEAVGREKQRRLRRAAAAWLGRHAPCGLRLRFDVISITIGPSGTKVSHLEDAF